MKPLADRDLEKLLEAFAEAWNRHDVEALMSMMTEDGIFEASAGSSANGERHEGRRSVRAAYEAVFAQYPDARWANARHFVKGNRGVSEWTFTGTLNDGRRVEVIGCDLFVFRNGKIAVKNSFRKNRPPMTATPAAPANVDEYIRAFPEEVQAVLRKVRKAVRSAAPHATDVISYRMPALRQHGVLVYYAAFKSHIGFYPPISGDVALKREAAQYAGEKGNLRFPLNKPIPYELIRRLTALRAAQDLAKAKAKGKAQAKPKAAKSRA